MTRVLCDSRNRQNVSHPTSQSVTVGHIPSKPTRHVHEERQWDAAAWPKATGHSGPATSRQLLASDWSQRDLTAEQRTGSRATLGKALPWPPHLRHQATGFSSATAPAMQRPSWPHVRRSSENLPSGANVSGHEADSPLNYRGAKELSRTE